MDAPHTFANKIFKIILLLIALFVAPLYGIIYLGPILFVRPVGNAHMGQFVMEKLLPDISVNGIAVGDFDSDGDDDVYVAGYPDRGGKEGLALINVAGELQQWADSGIPPMFASSAMFADIDNDGQPELFVAELVEQGEPKHLLARVRAFRYDKLRNQFEEFDAGFDGGRRSAEATFSFGDYDGDGDVDAVVSYLGDFRRYLISAPEKFSFMKTLMSGARYSEATCDTRLRTEFLEKNPELLQAVERDYGSMQSFYDETQCISMWPRALNSPATTRSLLYMPTNEHMMVGVQTVGTIRIYENETGRLVDRTNIEYPRRADVIGAQWRVGAQGMLGWDMVSKPFFQPVSKDFTGDGKVDIFVASDGGRNMLLVNRGEYVFFDEGAERGLAIKGTGMGVALADLHRTGDESVLVTNFGQLFRFIDEGLGKFSLDQTLSLGRLGFGWGIVSSDVDNDGWTDIYVSNGARGFQRENGSYWVSAEQEEESAYGGQEIVRNSLYANRRGIMHDESGALIPDLAQSTRPVAVTDLNGDGYEEFLVGGIGGGSTGLYVFRNMGGKNTYVQIKLEGGASNRSGAGAVIHVDRGDSTEVKSVLIGESFSAQHSMVKTFGLGEYMQPTAHVRVVWPSGKRTESEVPVNARTVLRENP